VSLAAVGDITMGMTPNLPPNGGAGFFSAVAPHLGGDVVLGNLETTLTTATASQCDGNGGACFDFRVPPSFARRLRQAGFTVLNLANNHSYDYFDQGLRDTVRALRRNGLLVTGRRGQIAYVDVGPARVAIVGFATYSWAQSMLDIGAAARLVRKAARSADLVVVTMHAGAEGSDHQHVRPGTEIFLGEDRGDVVAFSHAAVDAGADLVLGHGPHVLRGMEWYRGRLIAYSLGNFSGWNTFSLSGVTAVSGILSVSLRADGSWVEGDLFATLLASPGIPKPDAAETAHGVVRELSRQDFGRRAVRISRTGVLRPPAASSG
jgi:poly-gamma-glutamate capsule biosynthesis protein CapA/YwtB (metallophosphatase superfamily)